MEAPCFKSISTTLIQTWTSYLRCEEHLKMILTLKSSFRSRNFCNENIYSPWVLNTFKIEVLFSSQGIRLESKYYFPGIHFLETLEKNDICPHVFLDVPVFFLQDQRHHVRHSFGLDTQPDASASCNSRGGNWRQNKSRHKQDDDLFIKSQSPSSPVFSYSQVLD